MPVVIDPLPERDLHGGLRVAGPGVCSLVLQRLHARRAGAARGPVAAAAIDTAAAGGPVARGTLGGAAAVTQRPGTTAPRRYFSSRQGDCSTPPQGGRT